jgi:SAM-dependent methyltransferase
MGRTPARAAKRRRVVRPPVYASEGFCPVCQTAARFSARHAWHRDHLLCDNCGSIPRERALALVLEERFPNWRKLRIHESSPEPRGTSRKLAQECSGYVASQYFADLAPGAMRNGFRNENLERQSFADRAFDLVVTLDVMEHVNDPEACFKEIWRTLRPGGAYIFTTPTYKGSPESERVARFMPDGGVEHYREPEYHGNPVDPQRLSRHLQLWLRSPRAYPDMGAVRHPRLSLSRPSPRRHRRVHRSLFVRTFVALRRTHHRRRRLQERPAPSAVGFEIGAFGPFVPGIDEHEAAVGRQRPLGGFASGGKPSRIGLRRRSVKDVSRARPARLVVPVRHDAWKQVVRLASAPL